MKKWILVLLLALIPLAVLRHVPSTRAATNGSRIWSLCEQGNQTINTLAYTSSTATPVQRSYPGCTVTVYMTGTSTLDTIYSDPGLTVPLANPFTANANGYWYYYNTGRCNDVQLSGAGIPSPFTLGGLCGAAWNADPVYYGAVGDGSLHPLSDRYPNLAAAQSVYPFATSLTQSLDWAGIQLALNSTYGQPVYLCASVNRAYVIDTSIILGNYGNPPLNTFVSSRAGFNLVGGGRYNSACEIRPSAAIDMVVLNGRAQKMSQVRLNGNHIGHIGIVGYQFYGADITDNMTYHFVLDGVSINDTYNFTTTYNNLPNFNLPTPLDLNTYPLTNSDSTWTRMESFENGRDGIDYTYNNALNAPYYLDSIKWLDPIIFNNQRYGMLVRAQNTRVDGGRFYSNCAYGIAVGEDSDDGGHFPPDHLWFGTVIQTPWLEANGTNTNPTVCPSKPAICTTCGIYFSKVGVGNYLLYGQTFLQTETYALNAGTGRILAPPSYTGGLIFTDSSKKGIWVRSDIATGSPSISAFSGSGYFNDPTPPDEDLLLSPFGSTSKVRLKTNGFDRVIADSLGAWIKGLRVGQTDPGVQGTFSIYGDEYLQTVGNSHYSGVNLVNQTDPNKYVKIARLLPTGGLDGTYGLNATVIQSGDETDAQPIYLNFQNGDVVFGNYKYGTAGTRVITGGTTITAGMNTVQTTVTVASTANFPSYPFVAAIDLEGVTVTGAVGLTITVVRCPANPITCATTHSNGASLFVYMPTLSSWSSVSGNNVDLAVQPQGTTSTLHLRTNGSDRVTIDPAGVTTVLGNLKVAGGSTIIYRCTVAGTLRVGQTTSVPGDCGTAVDTGLRSN